MQGIAGRGTVAPEFAVTDLVPGVSISLCVPDGAVTVADKSALRDFVERILNHVVGSNVKAVALVIAEGRVGNQVNGQLLETEIRKREPSLLVPIKVTVFDPLDVMSEIRVHVSHFKAGNLIPVEARVNHLQRQRLPFACIAASTPSKEEGVLAAMQAKGRR